MVETILRDGAPADLPRLTAIYNHYVESSHCTFDVEPFSVGARASWLADFAATGPHRLLVAEHAGEIAGYASSRSFRPKPAYASSVETTIYLSPGLAGRGIGRRLYTALLDALAAEAGLHRAYANIALPNPASVVLHEALGFARVGLLGEVGFKFGRFWDVGVYEKRFQR
jgi:phosphinothricin acetyltransferase